MWYFAWILGLPLAAGFAVINAMWLEMQGDRALWDDADATADEDRASPKT
ncbi:cyd operon protein YbgT [Roseovarius lutimaris]|uniref:Cyd operon protein YbgT n=1 Tax=Roseovarius lutimaris TaxID=1005928 RepID=A0A1I5AK56_9RHOB|nr:cytochrome bd-I oxidase subunit CydX [Roseovarius lutimaris]SFN62599.1 cyd operon protein YbgT [Roseovarius lutimaris]